MVTGKSSTIGYFMKDIVSPVNGNDVPEFPRKILTNIQKVIMLSCLSRKARSSCTTRLTNYE